MRVTRRARHPPDFSPSWAGRELNSGKLVFPYPFLIQLPRLDLGMCATAPSPAPGPRSPCTVTWERGPHSEPKAARRAPILCALPPLAASLVAPLLLSRPVKGPHARPFGTLCATACKTRRGIAAFLGKRSSAEQRHSRLPGGFLQKVREGARSPGGSPLEGDRGRLLQMCGGGGGGLQSAEKEKLSLSTHDCRPRAF